MTGNIFIQKRKIIEKGNKPDADNELAISRYGGPVFESLLKILIEERHNLKEVSGLKEVRKANWDYVGVLLN